MNNTETIEYGYKKPKVKAFYLQNDMLQSVRLETKFTDEGLQIILHGRHEKGVGELIGPGQRVKLEEEDASD